MISFHSNENTVENNLFWPYHISSEKTLK